MHALGEPLDDGAADHLAACPTCTAEVESLQRVVGLGRGLGAQEALVAPPDETWFRIAAEAGVDPGSLATVARAPTPPKHPEQPGPADVLRRASTRRAWWVLAAGIVGILVGAGAVLGWQALDQEPETIASATLQPLPDQQTTGTAVVRDIAGERELTVDLAAPPRPDGYLEVWLLSSDAARLVSLGVLHAESGTFALPDELDLTDFPVVDVSAEPIDGDPAHSGNSIVRGSLAEA